MSSLSPMNGSQKVRLSGEISPEHEKFIVALPTTVQDIQEKKPSILDGVHPSAYVLAWIALSSSVILFNKWILSTLSFHYPVLLTAWHLFFSTIATQLLARFTTVLDSRHVVRMNTKLYTRAILPIGIFFSLSLICGNLTYLYLSVAFIQMLKATTPVAVLITGWFFGISNPDFKTLFNVSFIVLGVIIASFGEIKFVLTGFLFQAGGIMFEAIRLVMVQRLLNSADLKMDPLVSLYYFAPVCFLMNGLVALVWEVPRVSMAEIYAVGWPIFLANALVAFALNVSVVFLIGRTSSLVLTLCGVLKDILLVAASMAIFGTIVTPLQFLGYMIALGGLIYYKLGAEVIGQYASPITNRWTAFGQNRPGLRKLVTLGLGIFTIWVLVKAGGYDAHVNQAAMKGYYVGVKHKAGSVLAPGLKNVDRVGGGVKAAAAAAQAKATGKVGA